MSNPCKSDWERLKRLGRYLIDKTRVVVRFAYQKMLEAISIFVDTDNARCLEPENPQAVEWHCFDLIAYRRGLSISKIVRYLRAKLSTMA